jgi:hypothetical protein
VVSVHQYVAGACVMLMLTVPRIDESGSQRNYCDPGECNFECLSADTDADRFYEMMTHRVEITVNQANTCGYSVHQYVWLWRVPLPPSHRTDSAARTAL